MEEYRGTNEAAVDDSLLQTIRIKQAKYRLNIELNITSV